MKTCLPDNGNGLKYFAFFESLGKLIDNWLNIGLLRTESAIGFGDTTCTATPTVGRLWNDATHVIEGTLPLKTVGLTDTLYAVTNGETTLYQSTTHNSKPKVAIANWPFTIDTRFGVASVMHTDIFDADDEGMQRTDLLDVHASIQATV